MADCHVTPWVWAEHNTYSNHVAWVLEEKSWQGQGQDFSLEAKVKAKTFMTCPRGYSRPRPGLEDNKTASDQRSDKFYALPTLHYTEVRRFISERELMFTFAICDRWSVCRLSVVCRLSSVTLVHPTQAIEIFGNVSTPFGTLDICDLSIKILRRSSQGNPSVGRLK